MGGGEKKIRLFVIFPGEWKDFGHTTPLQNAVFASSTLDYRFNSGKDTKFSQKFSWGRGAQWKIFAKTCHSMFFTQKHIFQPFVIRISRFLDF